MPRGHGDAGLSNNTRPAAPIEGAMTPSIRCPFRRRSIPRHHPFWPPNSNQIDSGIRTIYDLSKGIALFGVFVPLVTFNGVWYKLVLAVSAGLAFFLTAWYLEGRNGSTL